MSALTRSSTSTPQARKATDGNTSCAKNGKRKRDDGQGSPSKEKRLRRFRKEAPANVLQLYERATTQRFYVLNRKRCGTSECPEEEVEVAGTTGNIYFVHISRIPSCTCPQWIAKKQCKHVLYVLDKVLHAPFKLVYQLSLLSDELQDIFAAAPQIGIEAEQSKSRKPVDGDCPICFTDLADDGKEPIVWCRAACGQNFHTECFQAWATTRRESRKPDVTCPLCRAAWKGDEDMVDKIKRLNRNVPVNEDGYINVADQLGISSTRDYSVYSPWFEYHQRGRS